MEYPMMKTRNSRRLIALTGAIACALLLGQPASAELLVYQVNGVVSEADTTFGSGYTPLFDELGFVPTTGDSFTLRYLVNTNTPGTPFAEVGVQYNGALSSMTLSVNHLGQQVGTISVPIPQPLDGYIAIQNNVAYTSSLYETSFYAQVGVPGTVTPTGNAVNVTFYTSSSTAAPLSPPLYPDTSISEKPLAVTTPNLSAELGIGEGDWVNGIMVASNTIDATYISASVSPVPLPGGVWLLGSGIIGLVALGRKQKLERHLFSATP
jgi:hypothetical protein